MGWGCGFGVVAGVVLGVSGVCVGVGGGVGGVGCCCWFCRSAVSTIEMRSAIAQRGCHFQQLSVCFSLSALIQICFMSLSVLFIAGPFCVLCL